MTLPATAPESFATDVLGPLVSGTNLERSEAAEALRLILSGQVDALLISSFLTALTAKGETADEMLGFIDAMVAQALTFKAVPEAIDIVGTGGDQLHTVNISTMAALTVAGAGVPVAKHGNRAASSSVGAADVLEALGVHLGVTPAVVAACIEQAGIGFMFAPAFHPGMSNLAPIRRSLGFRTVFNVLGPLANPALVERSLIGVAKPSLLAPMAHVARSRGTRRSILVTSDDGMDELSLGSPATVCTVTPETVVTERIDAPAQLGLFHSASALRGGDITANVHAVRLFLEGTPGPVFDVACANAGLALVLAGRATTLAEGFALATTSVQDGHASKALEMLVAVSNAG
jgi:anthranilate phosphoribosyltransferase